MSLNHVIKATCPDCKKDFPFEFWQSVNIQMNPEMREKVLDHSIFNFKCPHCGMEGHTEYPFLYNDIQHSFMVQYCPDENAIDEYQEAFNKIIESDANIGALNNLHLRIVTNYFQLIEKIEIFESGFDDCLIELLKAKQIKELNTNNPENKIAFALFELRPNKELNKKEPIPTLVYINEDGEEVSDCPISMISNDISKIQEDYDYNKKKSFIIDMDWANSIVYSEKISSALFDLEFDEDSYSNEGIVIAAKLLDMIDDEESKKNIQEALTGEESKCVYNPSEVSSDKVNEALQAFYRYTNFKAALEEIRRLQKYPWQDQLGFLFDNIDMNEFYTDYFKMTAHLFDTLCVYYIKALIHGAKVDPFYPCE